MRQVELSAGTIRYRDSGSGPPIVFVHGLLVDGTLWRNVTPALEDRFRCIVPDWPLGSHTTPMRPQADLSPRGVARLIGEFLGAMELGDATIVANDTGGALTQMLIAERPEGVGRVVLTPCDAFDNFLPPLFKPLEWSARVPGGLNAMVQSLRIRPLRRLPFAFGRLIKHPPPHDITNAWLRPFLSDRDIRRDTVRLVRAVDRRDTLEAADRLGSFRGQVLIAWATEDRVFPWEHAVRLAELLPDARLEEVADSYSFVPEDQPARLAELIGDFLAQPG
ncbi:MAG: alpha/beta hydrolase [Actinobacteria bacterium]|nr:alpha/beta hydrolase [Actinomycetota bacterium]